MHPGINDSNVCCHKKNPALRKSRILCIPIGNNIALLFPITGKGPNLSTYNRKYIVYHSDNTISSEAEKSVNILEYFFLSLQSNPSRYTSVILTLVCPRHSEIYLISAPPFFNTVAKECLAEYVVKEGMSNMSDNSCNAEFVRYITSRTILIISEGDTLPRANGKRNVLGFPSDWLPHFTSP